LSTAIFAPAWTYEGRSESDYLETDEYFWNGVPGKGETGVQPYIQDRVYLGASYFYTDFNRGVGDKYYHSGKVKNSYRLFPKMIHCSITDVKFIQ
jgi:endo-beta-N-acetylglucosaminidase D